MTHTVNLNKIEIAADIPNGYEGTANTVYHNPNSGFIWIPLLASDGEQQGLALTNLHADQATSDAITGAATVYLTDEFVPSLPNNVAGNSVVIAHAPVAPGAFGAPYPLAIYSGVDYGTVDNTTFTATPIPDTALVVGAGCTGTITPYFEIEGSNVKFVRLDGSPTNPNTQIYMPLPRVGDFSYSATIRNGIGIHIAVGTVLSQSDDILDDMFRVDTCIDVDGNDEILLSSFSSTAISTLPAVVGDVVAIRRTGSTIDVLINDIVVDTSLGMPTEAMWIMAGGQTQSSNNIAAEGTSDVYINNPRLDDIFIDTWRPKDGEAVNCTDAVIPPNGVGGVTNTAVTKDCSIITHTQALTHVPVAETLLKIAELLSTSIRGLIDINIVNRNTEAVTFTLYKSKSITPTDDIYDYSVTLNAGESKFYRGITIVEDEAVYITSSLDNTSVRVTSLEEETPAVTT